MAAHVRGLHARPPPSPITHDLPRSFIRPRQKESSALVGTSFSEVNGARALAQVLGRPIRTVIEYGASGLPAIREVLDELRQGTKAKVVVWEIVERGLIEQGWDDGL